MPNYGSGVNQELPSKVEASNKRPAKKRNVFRLKAKDDKLKAKAQDAKNPVKGAKLDLRRMFGK